MTTKTIAIVGHVDHGKSTLLGHLLLQTGQVEQREWEKICQEAEQRKMLPWKYAFLLDIFDEERESGKTSEHCVVEFTYENTSYKFIDTPGHQHLVKEMIAGVSKCSICILVISVKNGEFESGWNGQTREHLFISRGMGIKNLVIVWNKMDTINWDLSLLQPYQKTITSFLTSIGFTKFRECFVSGWTGENLTKENRDFNTSLLPSLLGTLKKINEEEKVNNTISCDEKSNLLLCKILILKDWPGILTVGWRGILHSGEWYTEIEIVKMKSVFAKGGDTVDVVIKCDNFLAGILRKNIILRQQSGTIAMGQIVESK